VGIHTKDARAFVDNLSQMNFKFQVVQNEFVRECLDLYKELFRQIVGQRIDFEKPIRFPGSLHLSPLKSIFLRDDMLVFKDQRHQYTEEKIRDPRTELFSAEDFERLNRVISLGINMGQIAFKKTEETAEIE